MSQITVRCHPFAPVATEELQTWLVAEVGHLREGAPKAAIRLLRLSQPGPEGEIAVGWQIELGASPAAGPPLDDEGLAELLRDLRMLGLQPSVLRSKNFPPQAEAGTLVDLAAEEEPPVGVSAEQMGQASFPASDPPAVWNWEVDKAPSVAGDD